MSTANYLRIACFGLSLALSASGQERDWFHAGPLYDEFNLTLSPGRRVEALGPLFNFEEHDSLRQRAICPVVSWSSDPKTDTADFDLLYPLVTYDRFGTEYRFQFLQVFSVSGGQNQEQIPKKRFTLFPIYFQQRSTEPDQNYTALFPLYGHLRNRLLRDEIHFILFPIYSRTRKRDVVTDNYLYPIFHLRRGEALAGWQFWPLAGHEHKDVTTQTNQFDEVKIVGGHDKTFVLWPIFFNARNDLGTDDPKRQQALLPFYSIFRSPQRDSSTYLWPLFTVTDDRGKKYREWGMPWPIVVFARGEGKTTSRVWPFFSRARNATKESAFYLWPLYKYNRLNSPPLDRERTRILFFLYSDTTEKNTESGATKSRVDLWPLFTRQQDFSGNTRIQLLSILEPLLPNNKSIERNYSPVWSLWRSEQNAQSGATSQSLLWNLYRLERSPETKKLSLLFGLFQYQSSVEGNRWRLLYVPFGKADRLPKPKAGAEPSDAAK